MSRNEPFESVPMANDHPEQAISLSQALLAPRVVIEDTQPVLDAGTFAAKAISGQAVAVSTKVYSDGHDRLAVMLNWRQANSRRWHCVPMHSPGNDLWLAEVTPPELGPHLFSIEAWVDPFATYSHDLEKKYNAGVEVQLELEEGRLMLGKLFVFVSYLKPHYSLAHRAMGVLVLWPAYWLAARATQQQSIWRPARVFLASIFLLQTAIIMLTVDDWDVRFLAPVLLPVFALAALRISRHWPRPLAAV